MQKRKTTVSFDDLLNAFDVTLPVCLQSTHSTTNEKRKQYKK